MLHSAGILAATALIVLAGFWGGLALGYRIRAGRLVRTVCVSAWGAVGAISVTALWSGRPMAGLAVFAAGLAAVLAWWRRLRPTNDADWADDVARMARGTVDADRVTLHEVRNFEWRSDTDYTPRWETRTYDLGSLRSVDMIMSYWRGPAIAHMLISFGFAASHVVFSVEIRRKRGQRYSEIGGFFKEFELAIIASDELDVVRLRTHVRGERVYLYPLRLTRMAMRQLFLSYVAAANGLLAQPRFYHTVTVNCTTLVYQMMQRIVGRLPLSYRLLFSGYMPEYVYAVGGLDRRHTLEELRERGFISQRARQSVRGENFSADIRAGIPRAK